MEGRVTVILWTKRPFRFGFLFSRRLYTKLKAWLITGSADRTARLWDVATTKAIPVFRGHTDDVRSVAVSADGKKLITLCTDQSLRLWDVETGKQLCRIVGFLDGNWAVVDP